MLQEGFVHALLDAARAAGIAEAEIYFQQADSMRVLIEKGQIDEYTVNITGGLSLRGLFNGKMGTAYTEAMDEDAVEMLVKAVITSASLINDEDEQFIFAGSPSYETVQCTGDPGAPEDRIALAIELDRLGRSLDEHVKDLRYTGVQSVRESIRIVNTRGLDLSHTADYCAGFLDVVARKGDRTTTGFSIQAAYGLGGVSAEAIAKEAIEEAVFQLDAAPCASGTMPVILRNTAMVDMLSTFSGLFSADAAQKGMSLLKDKEGEVIAASCVTLLDDPFLQGGFATRAFDAEGVATQRKSVIDGGVLTTLLHNLKTAKKAGCQSTGNAARAGYMGTIAVAPSNFFIRPGDIDLPSLEEKMGDGLVITQVEGLHSGANPVSGDFSLLAKGYLVKGGQRVRPVEQITVAGNFLRMLGDVACVGSDLRFPQGSVGAPSVLIGSLSVAGQ